MTDAPGEAAREFFAADLDRPVLIVGNGPSASTPDFDRLPPDPFVIRMNWFFLESEPHYGHDVDLFLFSVAQPELERRLTRVIESGQYEVRAIASPMKIQAGRDGERHRSALNALRTPQLDHWSVIAENPVLARYMMSRPLPTQGMQALGFALSLGFRDVTICGVDMYASTDTRYSYDIPDSVRRSLKDKDLAPGYEDQHSLDRDLDFVDACVAQYPDAAIRYIGPSEHLRVRFPEPDVDVAQSATRSSPLNAARTAPIDLDSFGSGSGERDDADQLPFAEIDGRTCGYVTLVGGPFHHGARALAHSLAETTDVPLLVMCLPDADRGALRQSGIRWIDVPPIANPNELTDSTSRFAATYSKLNAFRMTHLDRCVYVDADMIVRSSIDELFHGTGFAAVPDHGIEINHDTFNSGLFAFEPSFDTFADMLERIATTDSYDGGDQGFLNEYFAGDWQRLDHDFNVNKRWFRHHPNLARLETSRVIHFVGVKPWQFEQTGRYDELYREWFRHLRPEELADLALELRQSAPSATTTSSLRQRWSRRVVDVAIGSTPSPAGGTSGAVHSPDELAAARREGVALVEEGRFDEGIEMLETALARSPGHEPLRRSLAKAKSLRMAHRV
ncbi:MAG: alpha-2,3-sialyltransferase [Actinomycetota bacterium]